MKKLLAASALLFVFGAATAWLLFTASGLEVLLGAAARISSSTLSVEKVEGSLVTGMRVQGLRVFWENGSASARDVRLSWHPVSLLRGYITAESLRASGVAVVDNRAGAHEVDLRWLRKMPPYVMAFRVAVEHLALEDVSFTQGNEPVLQNAALTATVVWDQGTLSLRKIDSSFPGGGVSGNLDAGFGRRWLNANLEARLADSRAPVDNLLLTAALKEGRRSTSEVEGPIIITARRGKDEVARLDADIVVLRDSIDVSRFRARLAFLGAALAGDGSILFPSGKASFRLATRVDVAALPGAGGGTGLSGRVILSGAPSSYQGSVELTTKASSWKKMHLSGMVKGNQEGASVSLTKGEWLKGEVSGIVNASWRDGLRGSARFEARSLDPSVIDQTWEGRVNLDMDALLDRVSPAPAGRLRARFQESTIRGRPLVGRLDLSFQADAFRIDELLVKGKGFDVAARGDLREKIAFDVVASDLAGLIPSTRGSLTAHGWSRYNQGEVSGRLQGDAKGLRVSNVEVAGLQIDGSIAEGTAGRLVIDAQGHAIRVGSFFVPAATVAAQGTRTGHRLAISARGKDGSAIAASLVGGYAGGQWQGRITGLEVTGAARPPWRLKEEAALLVSRTRLSLGPFHAATPAGESVDVEAQGTFTPLSGSLRARWSHLDLSRLQPLLSSTMATGVSSGDVEVSLAEGRIVNLTTTMTMIGCRLVNGPVSLDLSESTISAHVDRRGANAEVSAAFREGGAVTARFSSPRFAGFSFPDEADCEASWSGFNVGLLQPWFPSGVRADARSKGGFRARVRQGKELDVTGSAEVAAGTVCWEEGGRSSSAPLEGGEVRVDWKGNDLEASIGLRVKGYASVTGRFLLPVPARLPVRVNPSGRLAIASSARTEDVVLLARLAGLPVEDAKGRMSLDLRGQGTWQNPGLEGSLHLAGAGFRIPSTGARIGDVGTETTFAWSSRGIVGRSTVSVGKASVLEGSFSCPPPHGLAFPERIDVDASWRDVDVALLSPFVPPGLGINGKVSGSIKGGIGRERVELQATSEVSGGDASWQTARGLVTAGVESGRAQIEWKSQALTGKATFVLKEYGTVRAAFSLPVPARFPLAADGQGPLKVDIDGELRESGVLAALMPGLVQETKGDVAFRVVTTGTWSEPRLEGEVKLEKAGAYIPRAGVRLQGVRLAAALNSNVIRITSFEAASGSGKIEGTGTVRLKGLAVEAYEGAVKGTNFQVLHLPDIRAVVNPRVSVEGSSRRMTIKGDLQVAEMQIYGQQQGNMVRPSEDVVVVDRPPAVNEASAPIPVDVSLAVHLGNRVTVKTKELEGRLSGDVVLTSQSAGEMAARGTIRLTEGKFRAYGTDLKITKGNLLFSGPLEQPALDILAVREVGEVKAGVTVSGTADRPVIRLYSQPAMSDADRLAYIILGRPPSGSAQESALLARAAGALLSGGEIAGVQERLKKHLGVESIEIESQEQMASTVVKIGKYFTPRLYVTYGRSLFTSQNVMTVRYTLSKRWEAQTNVGATSGGDIFFKIEFD